MVLPITLPGIVTGIALNATFTSALGVTLGLATVIIGHATFCIVIVFNNTQARLRRLGTSLEDASADLGASPWQTFRYVTFPMMRGALVAGAILAFALSFDEIVVTTFTAGPTVQTLPIWIFGNLFRPNQAPVINVVAAALTMSLSSRSGSRSASAAIRPPRGYSLYSALRLPIPAQQNCGGELRRRRDHLLAHGIVKAVGNHPVTQIAVIEHDPTQFGYLLGPGHMRRSEPRRVQLLQRVNEIGGHVVDRVPRRFEHPQNRAHVQQRIRGAGHDGNHRPVVQHHPAVDEFGQAVIDQLARQGTRHPTWPRSRFDRRRPFPSVPYAAGAAVCTRGTVGTKP